MPEGAAGGVLASDLDGTVIGVNSFPLFVRFLFRQLLGARRFPALALLAATAALRRAGLARHRHLKLVACRLGGSLPEADVSAWVDSILAEHGHPEVVELVQRWPGRALLTTAAPEVYAVHFARALGLTEVHGSVARGRTLTNNESSEKCVRLRAAGVQQLAVFLTDDLVIDAPVAAMAGTVYEVLQGGRVREVR